MKKVDRAAATPEEMPPRRIDESLVRSLHALLTEASVSRAAARLGVTQSALSRHLKALRELTGDELLVRVGNRMVPTEKGQSLLVPARRILGDLALLTTHDEHMELKALRRSIRIATYDFLPSAFFAGIAARLAAGAPEADVTLYGLGARFDHYRQLADGELDLVLTLWPELPPALRAAHLLSDPLVCVMRAGHPLTRQPWTLEAFARAQHLSSLEHHAGEGSVLDTHLSGLGISLHTVLRTQFLGTAPAILKSTDMIFSTGSVLARAMAADGSLVVLPFPVEVKPLRFKMVWHERTHKDRALAWFRGEVAAAARALR